MGNDLYRNYSNTVMARCSNTLLPNGIRENLRLPSIMWVSILMWRFLMIQKQ